MQEVPASADLPSAQNTTKLRWERPGEIALGAASLLIFGLFMAEFQMENAVQGGLPMTQSGSFLFSKVLAARRSARHEKSQDVPSSFVVLRSKAPRP